MGFNHKAMSVKIIYNKYIGSSILNYLQKLTHQKEEKRRNFIFFYNRKKKRRNFHTTYECFHDIGSGISFSFTCVCVARVKHRRADEETTISIVKL